VLTDAVESGQALTFVLGGETFGIDILRVREIRGWQSVTALPESAPHVLGVLNLRGTIVTVLDLRKRMAMPDAAHTATTVIIVVSANVYGEQREVGFVVDSVSDVTQIDGRSVQPMPEVGSNQNAEYIRGIVASRDSMIMLLDIDRFVERDAKTVRRADSQAA
jgi:purine-binding chemotaxis protein CheW